MTEKKISDDIIYGREALRKGVPWIVPESLEVLNDLTRGTWKVFEWGAGGSTVYFAKRCRFVVSVEHHPEWYDRVNKMLFEKGVRDDAHLMLVRGQDKRLREKNRFMEYASVINSYPASYFDLVFVDGEASSRSHCVKHAMSKVKKGGYLLLDNSDWLKWEPEGYERVDYVARDLKWVGQPGTFNWWTSILKRVK